jgi:hypothetical protein
MGSSTHIEVRKLILKEVFMKINIFEGGAGILDIRYDSVFKAVFTRDTAKSRGAK